MTSPVSPAPRAAPRRVRRRTLVTRAPLALAFAALALGACYDRPTAPPAIAPVPVPRHDFMADPGWGANNSAAAGSWDGTIEPIRGGAPPSATPLGPFVYPTFVRVRVTGEVRQIPGALPGSNIVRQPYNASDPEFWGVIGIQSGGDLWWATSGEAILRVVRPIFPFREIAGNQPRGDATHCGYPGYALCWSWAGSAHLDFVRLPVALTLARSPDTTVWVGTAATFTAGVSQTFFPPNPHPVGLLELRWRWLPDSAGSSADSVACDGILGPTCTRVFRGSGTMYASAYVNGEHQQQSVRVDVKVPRLVLTAAKTVLAAPGETDTFVAQGNGVTVVQGWNFTPDAGGAAPTLLTAPLGTFSYNPASQKPSIVTQITPPLVKGDSRPRARGRSVTTFSSEQSGSAAQLRAPKSAQFSVSVGSTWGSCVPNVPSCEHYVLQSGTVEVIATVNGVQRTASVHVTVIPCPTNDSLLDDGVIRRAMVEMLVRSNIMDPSVQNRREQSFVVWMDRTTKERRIEWIPVPTGATSCTTIVSNPRDTEEEIALALFHSHPRFRGESTKDCNPKGLPYNPDAQGGGSEADWDLARIHGLDVYAVSPERVWRLPKNTPDSMELWSNNPFGYDLGDKNGWKNRDVYDVGSPNGCRWLQSNGNP